MKVLVAHFKGEPTLENTTGELYIEVDDKYNINPKDTFVVSTGWKKEEQYKFKDVSEITTEEEAERFIIEHLKRFPALHKTPEHLINTYSALGGHPIRYCDKCCKLIDKFKIERIKGVKQGMWKAYYEEDVHEEENEKTRVK